MDGKKYLEHMAGIASLMEWMIANEKLGYHFHFDGERLVCDAQVTRRFLIGVPRSKKFGKYPFLAAQRREAVFLRLLNISRCVIREGDPHLHLIVGAVLGDGSQYPDLPPFVLSLAFDHTEKAEVIARSAQLDCRGFWLDDNGAIEIGTKAILWNLPLISMPAKATLLDASDHPNGPTFEDLIRLKIEATNVHADPGFIRS